MIFIEHPGAHERHLQRKYANPELFSIDIKDITGERVALTRHLDADALEDFMLSFQKVVERAVNLKPNEDSDVILKLKEELDQHYQLCCSMPGEMQPIKKALNSLINAIMTAVRKGAGNDMAAITKLDEEDEARREHFRLQELHIISDMMRDDDVIPADELGIALLCEPMNVLTEALDLFQPQQLASLVSDIHEKFSKLDDETIKPYQDKFEALSNKLMQSVDESPKN